jgi:hypothetical protein
MSIRIRHYIEISCSTNTKEEPDESVGSPKRAPPVNESGVTMLAFEMLWEGAPSSRDPTQNRSPDGDFPFEIDGISLTDSRAGPSAHCRVPSA